MAMDKGIRFKPSAAYVERSIVWRRIRDVMKGEDEVKKNAETHLTKPEGMIERPDLWRSYVTRAEFYPASSQTVVGFKGLIFRRPPVVELPGEFSKWSDAITEEGMSAADFSKLVTEEAITTGRYAVLVDMPAPPDGQEELSSKARPFLSGWCAEAIEDARSTLIEDPTSGEYRRVPSFVQLREKVSEPDPADEFATIEAEQIRILDLATGVYRVRLYRQIKQGGKTLVDRWLLWKELYPKGPNGEPLTFIPIIFIGATNLTVDIDPSPIEALVGLNLSHFRTSADLEWGAYLTACPTPWIVGWENKKKKKLTIGPGAAWTFEDEKVKIGILKMGADDLGALERRLASKEDKMAKLGAMLLRAKSKQPETAEATKIEHSSEASILSLIAGNVSKGIAIALQWAMWWKSGRELEATFELNREFYDSRMSPQELEAYMKGLQSGALPVKLYAHQLARGDMLPEGMKKEEAEELITEAMESPKFLPGGLPPAPPPGAGVPPKGTPPKGTPPGAPPGAQEGAEPPKAGEKAGAKPKAAE